MSIDRGHLRKLLATQLGEQLFNKSSDAIYIMDVAGGFIDANEALLSRISTTRDSLLSMGFQPIVATDEREDVQAQFQKAVSGETVRYLATGFDTHGEPFRSEIMNSPLYVEGKVVAVLGVARDIGPAEVETQAHEDLEVRFERVLSTISDAIFFLDSQGQITYVNPRGVAMARRPAPELEGNNIWEIAPTPLSAEVREAFTTAMQEQRTITVNNYSVDLDGWFETTVYPSPNGLALHIRDITESMAAVTRAKEADRTLAAQAALLDIATDAIVVRGLDHVVRYWNAAASALYGWSEKEAVGRSVIELTYSSETAAFDNAFASVLRDGYWAGELEQLTRSGHTIHVECRWNVVYDDDGLPESILSVNTDITERKREADRSVRTMRMESLGSLAGGIAHDLNNILTPMLMSVQLLAEDETDSVNLEILTLLESGVKRGADMVRQVVSFARGVESRKVRVDINRLVRELDSFARDTIPPSITVVSNIEPVIPPVLGDPTQLMQVLVNFVTNARDAMPEGGVLTIGARTGESNTAIIDVTDSGEGMSEEVLANIFEPFFTTKLPGIGTGLGLATSASIIDNHDARITVSSTVGEGTTFSLEFSAAVFSDARILAAESDEGILPPRGNGECVLIVDDELAIRMTTQRVLENHGYRTVIAENGLEALMLVDGDENGFDLVFTDMTMPVMGGMDTAESLFAHHPHIPVIATSGYTMSDDVDLAKTAGITEFVPKPYTTAELLWAVHRALVPVPRES